MEKLEKEIEKHYDRNQIFYKLFWMNKKNLGMHYGFWGKKTKNLHEAIINENKAIADIFQINKSDMILDAGCGVGGTSIWLAENYGVKVTGIAISKKQIELAKKYAKERKVDHLTTFKVRDFCNTNFPNESFTKIFAIESMCHALEKEAFIKEMFRLLKTNGKLVVADFFIIKEVLNKKEQDLIDKWCYGWEMPNLSKLANFREKMEIVGFKNIECWDKTIEITPSSKIMYILIGKLLRFILKITRLLGLRKSHGGTTSAINQYYAFKNKIATYNIFLARKI